MLISHESIVPYEDIPEQIIRVWNPSRLYLMICLFFVFLLFFQLYGFFFRDNVTWQTLVRSGVWFSMASFGTWMQSPKYIGYYAHGNGVLFFDTQGKDNPREFLQRLQEIRAVYLRKRYGTLQDTQVTREDQDNIERSNGNLLN
ncbi:hypothetical protein [Crocosphaera sp. XPORK-15E]|uniref:hypothetical protein n=1 Tax=Crocosphaera sp. XPORK-15E TaxID=3110247 RepID=UPI002B2015E4|nr:hypothetical protein [Crocosphaera sp. XPORK-15E]